MKQWLLPAALMVASLFVPAEAKMHFEEDKNIPPICNLIGFDCTANRDGRTILEHELNGKMYRYSIVMMNSEKTRNVDLVLMLYCDYRNSTFFHSILTNPESKTCGVDESLANYTFIVADDTGNVLEKKLIPEKYNDADKAKHLELQLTYDEAFAYPYKYGIRNDKTNDIYRLSVDEKHHGQWYILKPDENGDIKFQESRFR